MPDHSKTILYGKFPLAGAQIYTRIDTDPSAMRSLVSRNPTLNHGVRQDGTRYDVVEITNKNGKSSFVIGIYSRYGGDLHDAASSVPCVVLELDVQKHFVLP